MAPKAKQTAGLRGLAYQESFFGNRNDMLQTALDSVLVTYEDKMEKYQASVELYKDAQALIAKERARIQGIIDGLLKEQIKGAQAAKQFNAGQLNSSARTNASIDASNARFNARQAALAEYYGTKGSTGGTKGVDDVTISEARQAYSANIDDVQGGVDAYKLQTQQTTEVPKTAADVDVGIVTTVDQYVSKELEKGVYRELEPELQRAAATDAVLSTLKFEDQDAYKRGVLEKARRSAGGRRPVGAEEVQTGGFATQLVGAPDYSDLIRYNQERLRLIEDMEKPEAPEAPDLIKLQRDEYFKSFYPGYVPAYQVNEAAKALTKLSDEEAQALLALYRSRAPQPIDRTPEGIEVSRFTPPRMLGDVIYGDESPFVPPPSITTPSQREQIERYKETGVAELTPYFRGIPTLVKPSPTTLPSTEPSAKEAELARKLLSRGQLSEMPGTSIGLLDKKDLLKKYDQQIAKLDQDIIDERIEREKKVISAGSEIMEGDKPFTYPVERRGGELVTPLRKPAGIVDRREVAEKSVDQKDLEFKVKTAEKAMALDDAEFSRMSETPVGKEVSELYKVAKAKGTDETGKEFMSYIAQMYPKKKDQEIAATLYYNLAYKDEVSGKLAQEKEGKRKGR